MNRTVVSIVTHGGLGRSNWAVVAKWALFAHIFIERTDLVHKSACGTGLRLYSSFNAVVAFGTLESS
jgi:hypothetical protein